MSLQVIHYPHPVLRHRSKPIKKVDAELRHLVAEMFELMYEHEGVGLAANQVGLPYRLFVANPQADRDSEETEQVFINPVIRSGKGLAEAEEGCLSIPGYTGRVKRSERVHVKALGVDGKSFRIKAEGGLLAEVLEHETDHLNGILYIERLVSREQLYKIDYKRDEPSEASYMAETPDIRE